MNIEQKFFDAYIELYRPYINRANSVLSVYNLYSSQWLVLKDIAINGTTTLVDVSKRRQIEKPTANKVIKHLLELNLIESTPGEDRRVKHLTMTDEGSKLFNEVRVKMHEMQSDVLKHLSEQEIKNFINVLEKMNI